MKLTGYIGGFRIEKIKISQTQIKKDSNVIWNKFVKFSCSSINDISQLSEIQKNAVLCFWYHSEICNGGHTGFFDWQPDLNYGDLLSAIKTIKAIKCAKNFENALKNGNIDDYEETDKIFYELESEFVNLIETYIKENILNFFEID